MGEVTQPPARNNRLNIATFVVAVLILAAVLGMLGLDIWRNSQPSMSGLAEKVQNSMDQYLSTDSNYRQYGAKTDGVTLMRVAQNSFEGQAMVENGTGRTQMVPVHIKYDGDTMFWQTDPGAFIFLAAPGN